MAEGAETPLLGQQLLVRNRVDVRRKAERGAEKERRLFRENMKIITHKVLKKRMKTLFLRVSNTN